ncbi:MAG: class II aldolase/adducin family protein [Chloroherpetonaceae bacterium]|nr:class II aldolase/adducin family protein [Chthonomonadaceae bacterium]MDW8209338.1 class II aldolase/adducin family protein [Chloroherpetonaceae bacterium]
MALWTPEQCRQGIAEIGRLIYDRRLSDSAGGNLSQRATDGNIYMSPRYAGSRYHWQLRPDDVICLSPDGQLLQGHGELSREVQMHLAIYQALPECHGICHAHPYHLLVFASAELPLPPPTEQTEKYGTIPLARFAPCHSPDLARVVVEALLPQREKLRKHAIACLLPRHGITIAGRDLNDAYDALERLDGSAKIWIDRATLLRADILPR